MLLTWQSEPSFYIWFVVVKLNSKELHSILWNCNQENCSFILKITTIRLVMSTPIRVEITRTGGYMAQTVNGYVSRLNPTRYPWLMSLWRDEPGCGVYEKGWATPVSYLHHHVADQLPTEPFIEKIFYHRNGQDDKIGSIVVALTWIGEAETPSRE